MKLIRNKTIEKVKNNIKFNNFIILSIIISLFSNILYFPVEIQAATIQSLRASSNNLGLIGLWSLDGDDVTDKIYDRSGQAYHGTFSGGATSSKKTVGKIGQAMNFDGTDDCVIGNASPVSGFPFTLAAWAKIGTGGRVLAISDSSAAGQRVWNIYTGATYAGMEFREDAGATNYFLTGTTSINDGQWHHIVGVFASDTDKRLYVDSILEASSTVSKEWNAGADRYSIGCRADSGPDNYFDGSIDDARVYNRELSITEIRKLFNSGKTRQGIINPDITGLVSRFTFDGADVTDKIYDKAGTSHNGSLIGVATSAAKTTGKIGQAFQFDGVDDYLDLNDTYESTVSGDNTIMLWAKKATTSSAQRVAMQLNYTSARNASRIEATSVWRGVYRAGTLTSTATADFNRWHHIAMVRSSTTAELYVNGRLEASASDAEWPTTISGGTKDGCIGASCNNGTTTAHWFGMVDDARIYNRRLTAAEIKKIYSQGTEVVNSSNNSYIRSGLIGYWSMDGADITDKVYDRSGNNNNGTISGAATSTTKAIGKLGQAMKFNGSTIVTIPDNDSLDNTDKFSMAFWVKPTTLDGTARGIVSKRLDSTNENAYTAFFYTGDKIFVDIAHNADRFSTNTVFQVNQWYHVLVVFDGTLASGQRSKVYVNGALDVTAADVETTIPNRASNLLIGGMAANGTTTGFIDDVRLYNTALTATDALKLYNIGR